MGASASIDAVGAQLVVDTADVRQEAARRFQDTRPVRVLRVDTHALRDAVGVDAVLSSVAVGKDAVGTNEGRQRLARRAWQRRDNPFGRNSVDRVPRQKAPGWVQHERRRVATRDRARNLGDLASAIDSQRLNRRSTLL